MKKNSFIQPLVVPVDLGIIPEARSVRLHNNIPVYLIKAGTEDIARIEFTFCAGSVMENLPLLASTTNLMLTEGTENYSAVKLNKELDFYGSFYHLFAEKDRAGIVIYCMNKHLEKILALVSEILFNPVFPHAELNTLMKKRLSWYLVNREKVHNLAMDQFFESIFGNNHPYGRKVITEDFNNINSAALKDFHSGFYTHKNLAIIVAGNIHEKTVDFLDHYFGKVGTGIAIAGKSGKLPESQKKRKIHIEKTGAVQTAIIIGSATINKRHSDYPGLKILNVLLGGYFGSRLMKNIRENKGYTYGINSSVHSLDLRGYQVISAEVSKQNARNAVEEIFKELRILQRIPAEKVEIEIIRNYMLGDMVRMFDGPFAIAESFRSAWEFGLDNSYYYTLAEKIKSISPDEITALAKTYYSIDDLYEITAGSK
jgi:predicted Zn-dependent peptidase